jgi:GAF domain-containing protein
VAGIEGDYEARYPASASRTASMEAPSQYAVVALPILVAGVARGVLALTFTGERTFDDDERGFLEGIALHCAQGFERARLYEAAILAHERDVADRREPRGSDHR